MKKLFGLLVVLFASVSFAQVVLSPQSIVVNPLPSFEVELFVDKDPSGNNIPSYTIGEQIRIGVKTTEAAYVYLYNVKANGQIQQILPNRLDQQGQNNRLAAGETKFFPPQNARYTFSIAGPNGLDKVIAVASKDALNTTQLASFSDTGQFASSNIGEQGFAQTLSIIVQPIPQDTWVTDTVLFNTVAANQAPPPPAFGTLNISSTPSGARAFVDNQFVGRTPVRFGTRTGQHTIRVELDGYNTFQSTVNLAGGQTQNVNASLAQVQRTGTVNFVSSPSGATVTVGGTSLGVTPTGAVSLNEGNYQVRISLAGYSDFTTTISVASGSNQTVTAQLQGLTGSLALQANVGGARVFINGNEVGSIPSGTGRLNVTDLPAGTHELVVIASGFRTLVRDFEIRSGLSTTIRVTQSRR